MLIHEGTERSDRVDLGLAASLSMIAGGINAMGFLVAGSFTANMTGNVALAAEYIARRDLALALSFAGLLVCFILGAMTAALLVGAGQARGRRAIYAQAILGEALLLIGLGVVALGWPGGLAETLLVGVLSLVMGFQNAITTMISCARVRTTHVSGMATDLGIELAAMLGPEQVRRGALPGLWLHGLTLVAFTVGGVLGTAIFLGLGNWLLPILGAALLALALPDIARVRRRRA
ncbi:DUF1275 domain-containing protein [Ponticoccus gilvus]|nr:DUF1275 domain-containing protein [Enemella evansiae]